MTRVLIPLNAMGTSVATFMVCELIKHHEFAWAAFATLCGMLCMANNYKLWREMRQS